MTTIAIAALLVLGGANQQPKLDYTANALPLRVALKEMGEQAKVPLTVSRELENEPIILRLKDVPLKEAMDRIASTVEAEWAKTDDGGFRLWRSPAIIARLEEEAFVRRVAAYKAAIERLRDATRQETFTKQDAERLAAEYNIAYRERPAGSRRSAAELAHTAGLASRLPVRRLLARVLQSLDLQSLARVEPDTLVVLSTSPTAAQHRLQIDRALIEEYARSQRLFANSFRELAERQRLSRHLAYSHFTAEPNSEGLRLQLSFFASDIAPWARTHMQVVDERGQVVTSDTYLLTHEDRYKRRLDEEHLARELQGATGVSISPAVRELSLRLSSEPNYRPDSSKPLSDPALQVLLQPERIDPAAVAVGEVALALAEAEGLNVVLHPTDRSLSFALTLVQRDPVLPDEFFYRLSGLGDFTFALDDDWLVGRCENPLAEAEQRIPRPVLGAFIRKVAGRGYLSIDDAASLAITVADGALQRLPALYTSLLPRDDYPELLHQPELLRLYASLTPSQREISQSGQSLGIGSFTGEQRDLLNAALLSGEVQLGLNPAAELSAAEGERFHSSVMTNPTESLPDGLPDSTEIVLREATEPRYMVVWELEDGRPSRSTSEIESLASYIAQAERLDLFPWMANQRLTEVATSHYRSFAVTINASKLLTASGKLEEVARTGSYFPLARFLQELPEDRRVSLEKVLAETRERFKNMKPFPDPDAERNAPQPPF